MMFVGAVDALRVQRESGAAEAAGPADAAGPVSG